VPYHFAERVVDAGGAEVEDLELLEQARPSVGELVPVQQRTNVAGIKLQIGS
jgi:hypothetical protein